MTLPAEGAVVGQPFVLGAEYLLNHVAAAAVAAAMVADVEACLFHFWAGIARTDGAPHAAEHLKVGYVVAHVHHFLIGQPVAPAESFVVGELDGAAHQYVADAEALVAQPDALCGASGEDDNAQAELHSQLYGVAVLDVDGAQRFAFSAEGDGLGTEYTIYVEDDGGDAAQVVVDHS